MKRGDAHYPEPTSAAVTSVMKGNRRTDTRPELALRSALHQRGLRFRKDFKVRAGDHVVKIDVVFPAAKVAVFLDGCFWHRCPDHGHSPRSNSSYWGPKLDGNVERDRRNDAALGEAGWTVVRVWEHEAPGEAAGRISELVRR